MRPARDADVDIGGKRYRITSDDDYLEHIRNGFEPDMVRLFQTLARSTDVVCDVGANIGCTAILFAGLCAHVHAFEPSPTTFGFLQKNIARSGLANVSLHNIGLGMDPGGYTLTFSPADRSGGFVSNQTRTGDGYTVERIRLRFLQRFHPWLYQILPGNRFHKLSMDGAAFQLFNRYFGAGRISR